MGINLIIWLAVGVLSGSLVYLFFGHDKRYLLGTILAGVVGAFVGGIIYFAIRIGATVANFSFPGLFWAMAGSLALIVVTALLIKSEGTEKSVNDF